MYNSFDPVAQIIAQTPAISEVLKDAHLYWAHVPKNRSISKAPESLEEHIELVLQKFEKAVEVYGLDPTINRLIEAYTQANFDPDQVQKAGNYIKKLFVHVVSFHDHGKVNVNFQALPEKMNNPKFKPRQSVLQHFHSALGAYIYLAKYINEINVDNTLSKKDKGILSHTVIALSYAIFKHHSTFLDKKEATDYLLFNQEEVDEMFNYLKQYLYQVHPKILDKFHIKIAESIKKVRPKIKTPFTLTTLIRLNFSLLTASDYMASGEYMNGFALDDFKILTPERVTTLYQNVAHAQYFPQSKKLNYNRFSYKNMEYYSFKNPKTPNNKNLNTLRMEMAIEVIQNVRANDQQNLFYIEAPTGGGKTNLSMLATIELLKANAELNRVFYVFPFTTLITQTYSSIIETLGLSHNEIVALHSKAGFKEQMAENEETDAQYGKDKINFVDNLFVNYPFCLLSHIKFFDILKGNKKSTNYLLHRLANSIVVIDELQSYAPHHWDKIIHLIQEYAHYFNIKFILMSATLPKLDKISSVAATSKNKFIYLLPNAKTAYFQNPNFNTRVSFNMDLLQHKKVDLTFLAQEVLQKSKKYALYDFGKPKPANSVYTIIEFIFKKTASLFQQLITEINDFFDEIFVLSGTILAHQRQHIINYLKNPANRKKRILLISTQVVEAGVDIDMDIGFKDQSLIDSDEQLAGRINRNVNKQYCTLYLFQRDQENIIYGNDLRLKITKNKISPAQRQEILSTKNFDLLYDLVLEDINQWNKKKMADNLKTYLNHYQQLDFRAIHQDFQLIEQENLSIFVPLQVPLKVAGENTKTDSHVFSDNEVQFLIRSKVIDTNSTLVDGAKVFTLYEDLIENKIPDFIQQATQMQVLQGILSKFVFSVFKNTAIEQKFKCFADEEKSELGFLYLSHWEKIYDIQAGIKDSQFENIQNQFL